MKKIYTRILIGLSVGAPIVGTATYLGLSISRNQNNKISSDNSEENRNVNSIENEEGENIFPNLNQSTFYDYLVLKEGKPIITNNLIANVIKYTIPRINTTNENVTWSYKLSEDKTKCLFYFEVIEDGQKYKKEYFFDVK